MSGPVPTDEHGGAITPFDNLTARIKVQWKRHEDNRVSLGCLLAEAKRRVDAGEWIWCVNGAPGNWQMYLSMELHLGEPRSDREIRRLIAIGNREDPEAAAEDDRARARAGMQRLREKRRTNVSPAVREPMYEPPPRKARPSNFDRLCAAWELADDGERRRFLAYIGARRAA